MVKNGANKICKLCGEEFYVPLSWLKKERGSYCSMECFRKSERFINKKRVVRCNVCNKEFSEYYSNKTRKYCSNKCLYKSRIGKPSGRKGKRHTLETRIILSIKGKGRMPWCYGKKLSKDHRKKISLNHHHLTGKNHPLWNGGITKHSSGYLKKMDKNHPFTQSDGYVFLHRLIIEQYLNRHLKPEETVHHINGIKDDNRIENLMCFKTDSAHIKFERKKEFNNEDIIFDGRRLHPERCRIAVEQNQQKEKSS
jgi:hypothetical protein